jgi:hypothetical protein
MPKKSTSKSAKSYWDWGPSTVSSTPSDAEKTKVSKLFEPWIAEMKADLPPLQQPQDFNQVIDYFARWKGSSFYIIEHYKAADLPNVIKDHFEVGLARLTYKSSNAYDLAYFRHTGKYFTIFYDLTLEQAFDEVKTNPIFHG